jgi:hypothetical protein
MGPLSAIEQHEGLSTESIVSTARRSQGTRPNRGLVLKITLFIRTLLDAFFIKSRLSLLLVPLQLNPERLWKGTSLGHSIWVPGFFE